ncbi:unnamed protein product, partial [Discosporangium mesarthrocarpum]
MEEREEAEGLCLQVVQELVSGAFGEEASCQTLSVILKLIRGRAGAVEGTGTGTGRAAGNEGEGREAVEPAELERPCSPGVRVEPGLLEAMAAWDLHPFPPAPATGALAPTSGVPRASTPEDLHPGDPLISQNAVVISVALGARCWGWGSMKPQGGVRGRRGSG